jgi:phage shock protein PspC (stress-responsive transcriptional regulator)
MNRRLYRSRKDKMIAGVCSGLGEYFDIDPTLVRIIFVVSLFLGGSGILAYIILWIVVPEEPRIAQPSDTSPQSEKPDENAEKKDAAYQEAYEDHKHKRKNFFGALLIIIGVLFLADNFLPRFDFGDYWPLILIAIGAALILNSRNNNQN